MSPERSGGAPRIRSSRPPATVRAVVGAPPRNEPRRVSQPLADTFLFFNASTVFSRRFAISHRVDQHVVQRLVEQSSPLAIRFAARGAGELARRRLLAVETMFRRKRFGHSASCPPHSQRPSVAGGSDSGGTFRLRSATALGHVIALAQLPPGLSRGVHAGAGSRRVQRGREGGVVAVRRLG